MLDQTRHPAVQFEGEVQVCTYWWHYERDLSMFPLTEAERAALVRDRNRLDKILDRGPW